MVSDDLILGLDIGTTTVKLAVYTLSGDEKHRFAQAYPTRRAGSHVEQDPSDWMAAVHAGLAEIHAVGLSPAIVAVGVTSQVNTHVFVAGDGMPLAPAITWADTRCADVAARLDGTITDADRMAWWGAPMGVDASHMAARMAWMAEHQPQIWAACDAVLLPKDFVIAALTGQRRSDPVSHVGAVGLSGDFVTPLFERISGGVERLPELADPRAVAGQVRLPGATRAVPVATGLMDAWAGMLGVGVSAPGDAMYLSGTSEIPGVVSDEVHPSPGVLVFPPHLGLRLHAAPTQSGGAALQWLCHLFSTSPATLMDDVAAMPEGVATPLFLPHLAGERAPLWDAAARGSFFGLEAAMGRAEMARGVLEGVAMSVRLAFEALDVSAGSRAKVLNCGGGGFASDIWNQIRADTLAREIRCLSVRDPGALGAAALAAVAAGVQPNLADALKTAVQFDRSYHPSPAARDRAEARFALFKPAYDAARETNHALAAAAKS